MVLREIHPLNIFVEYHVLRGNGVFDEWLFCVSVALYTLKYHAMRGNDLRVFDGAAICIYIIVSMLYKVNHPAISILLSLLILHFIVSSDSLKGTFLPTFLLSYVLSSACCM